jgi:hypothetical protein
MHKMIITMIVAIVYYDASYPITTVIPKAQTSNDVNFKALLTVTSIISSAGSSAIESAPALDFFPIFPNSVVILVIILLMIGIF